MPEAREPEASANHMSTDISLLALDVKWVSVTYHLKSLVQLKTLF